jgi:hypothetical protein
MMRRIIGALSFVFLAIILAKADDGTFAADSKINVTSTQIVSNTTAIVISSVPAILYGIDTSNLSPNTAWIKLYNAATATCGSGTPVSRTMIPSSTVAMFPLVNGDAYGNGITMCVTAGYADSDTTNPANNEFVVNLHWKKQF